MRRVIFDAAIFRRIVRRSDDDGISKAGCPSSIKSEDGVGHHRRGGIAIVLIHAGMDLIRSQHFKCGALGRFGKRMGVLADEEGTGGAGLTAGIRRWPV